MKTLKQIKSEIVPESVLNSICHSFNRKMGGTRKLFVDGELVAYQNCCETYSGRGTKYNNSISYDYQVYNLTRKEYEKAVNEFAKLIFENEKEAAIRIKANKARSKRILEAKNKGIYSLKKSDWCEFVEFSEDEIFGKYFDSRRLANTLNISVEDAELLKSIGKTYVFAKTTDGKLLELYHSSLDCNNLSISIIEISEEKLKEFDVEEWHNAPYSHLVGQTSAKNHFVC